MSDVPVCHARRGQLAVSCRWPQDFTLSRHEAISTSINTVACHTLACTEQSLENVSSNRSFACITHCAVSCLLTRVGVQHAGEKPEKKRTPAWTDRILWRAGDGLTQQSYDAAALMASDHRPVFAVFQLQARVYSRVKIDTSVDAARRIVDAREMEARPK